MKKYFQVAVGDLISKGLLIISNLYLIRCLSVNEYSHFSVLLNAIFLGYQVACGPIERLYIAENELYKDKINILKWIFSLAIAIAIISWLRNAISILDALLIVSGILLLTSYQVQRIIFQQKQSFYLFSVSEILKNSIWLALLFAVFNFSGYSTGSVAVTTLLMGTFTAYLILLKQTNKQINKNNVMRSINSIYYVVWKAKNVIIYSIIGSILPYLPILMVSLAQNYQNTATYGAALRYQAILGMAVYTLNTVLLPQIAADARTIMSGVNSLAKFYKKLPIIMLAFASVVLIIYWAIPIIDNGKYPKAPLIFAILSITSALSLIATPSINLLLIHGRTITILICMALGLFVNVFAYYNDYLFSVDTRAAWSSALGYTTVNFALMYYAKKYAGYLKSL